MTEESSDRRDVPDIETLDGLAEVVASTPGLHVRYSKGPERDAVERSVDYESGLEMPGLSANPLTPEAWWSRPLEDWVARQLCQYVQLRDHSRDERHGWVIEGRVVGRGPDCEPLLADVRFVARITDSAIDQARRRYDEHFDVGADARTSG